MITELEPCPFCGSEAIETRETRETGTTGEVYVWHVCGVCGCETEGADGHRAAADQWNTRAPSPAARERDEMRDALQRIADGDIPEFGNGNSNDLIARDNWRIARRALKQKQPT